MYQQSFIKGFTTNPTLMHAAGVIDFESFARAILNSISDRPISFEVFSDDFDEMYEQALKISQWGKNVYVKIPITNTKGESSIPLVRKLSAQGVKLNITAILTVDQVQLAADALSSGPSSYISVFAGRIADTGCDPLPIMQAALNIISAHSQLELIWASTREIFNIVQANTIGCHIITVPNDLLKKLSLLEKDLNQYSLETVQVFRNDAIKAGYQL
jgi:transaldolase